MNKQMIKVAVISVLSTLAVVALVAVIALPKVIDGAKAAAVANFDDEYQELSYILGQSAEPVIQPNYIITGLIMSPDFQEYLDEGVQNGWWTEEFLEEFLIDEALPIFFTNYHGLFSLILGSEPVQEVGETLTLVQSKVQDILFTVKIQLGRLNSFLNSPTIGNIKRLVADLEANKEKIAAVIQTLQGLDVENINATIEKLQASLGQLEDVIATVKNLDVDELTANVESLITGLTSIVESVKNFDTDGLNEVINNINEIKATIDGLDKEQLAEDIAKLKAIVATIQATDFSELIELLNNVISLIESIQNGEFDGVLGDLLESILNSDAIQNIIGDLQLTVENIIKLLQFYFNKFVDYDHDYNFFEPVTIAGQTIDLSAYARILNVIDVEIPTDGFVYDNNGTPAKLGDDTLTITTAYVGFEIDGEPTTNVLSAPIVIEGSNAVLVKNFIPTLNAQV